MSARFLSRRVLLRRALGGSAVTLTAAALAACGGAATAPPSTASISAGAGSTASVTTSASAASTSAPATTSSAAAPASASLATTSATTASAAQATTSATAAPSTSSAAARPPAGKLLTLEVWQNWGAPGSDPRTDFTVKTLVPAYAQQHPGVIFNLTFAGNGTAVAEKITANVAAGTPPDVSFVYAQWTVGMGQKGVVIPLDDLIARTKGFDKGDFFPHLWEALTYDNKIWGFPQNNHAFAIFYRSDLFQSSQVDPASIKTWDDFVAVAQKVTHAANGQFASDTGPGDVNFWDTVQRSNGGDYLSTDHKKVAWNSQEGLQALQYHVDLLTKYQVAPPKSIDNGFATAKIAMTIAGPWRVNGYLTQKLPVLSIPMPSGSVKHTTHANVDTWGILKTTSERQQAGFDFVAWYGSKPVYMDWAIRFQHGPLTRSIAADPAYQKFVQETPIMAAFLDSSVEPHIVPLTPVTDQLTKILSTHHADALQGKTDARTALEAAVSEGNAALAQAQ